MLNIYKRFWQVNWAEQWQYRANLLMYLAYWLVSPIVYLSVWTTIANAQGGVNGMSASDFAAYYLVLLPVDIATAAITIHLFASKIQDGTLSNSLVQPVHPVLVNTLVNTISFKALQLIIFVPIWIGLFLLFRPPLTITPESALLAIPALILGFLLNFLVDSTITLIAFWTTRVWSIHQLYWAIGAMLGGSFVPLSLLPGVIQTVARFSPMQLWLYFPIQLILNKQPPADIALNFGLQLVWLAIMFVVFRTVWSAGLKKYSAVGA